MIVRLRSEMDEIPKTSPDRWKAAWWDTAACVATDDPRLNIDPMRSLPSSNNVEELPIVPKQNSPSATSALARTQQYTGLFSADTRRPPPLQGQPGCELWRGKFSGNDPSISVEARLCPDQQGHITGVVQWSSLESCYNVREVEGLRASNGDVSLYDMRFREYHPTFWWTFCLIDRYTLTRDGEQHLVGSYVSQACHDSAHVDLIRVDTTN